MQAMKKKSMLRVLLTTRTSEEEELFSAKSLNRPAMNGEQQWKPLRQALSLRRLSTSPSSTCTRWPTVMEMLMTDYREGTYLKEQVEAIKEIADLVTKMKRAGDGLGLHIIDKELLG